MANVFPRSLATATRSWKLLALRVVHLYQIAGFRTAFKSVFVLLVSCRSMDDANAFWYAMQMKNGI